MWTDKMQAAITQVLNENPEKTYELGTWDCDIFVETIIQTDISGAKLPETFKSAKETNVKMHIDNMKGNITKEPKKGTNIVFHGGNHTMLLGKNADNTIDVIHLSSSNKDKKPVHSIFETFDDFQKYWGQIGNGDLKFVPLDDYQERTSKLNNINIEENYGGGK